MASKDEDDKETEAGALALLRGLKSPSNRLTEQHMQIDKDALKFFADAPKLTITVVSFVTTTGALMFRLSQSSSSEANWTLISIALGAAFIIGMIFSFLAIMVSYGMVSSITACYINILDPNTTDEQKNAEWRHIILHEASRSEICLIASVFIWLSIISICAFRIT